MKRAIISTAALIVLVLTMNPLIAQDRQHHQGQEQMMEMMQNSDMMSLQMMCMQMMNGDDMDKGDNESGDDEQQL